MEKEANGRPTLAKNDFGRRLHPSYGAMQLIEGWEGTKVAGGDLQEEQEENFMEEQEEICRSSRRRFTVGAGGEFGGGAGGMGGDMEEGVDKVAREENLGGEETENSK